MTGIDIELKRRIDAVRDLLTGHEALRGLVTCVEAETRGLLASVEAETLRLREQLLAVLGELERVEAERRALNEELQALRRLTASPLGSPATPLPLRDQGELVGWLLLDGAASADSATLDALAEKVAGALRVVKGR